MGGSGIHYSLKILAHYSSDSNFGLFIKIKTNYSFKVRKVAKKSEYYLFSNFFFNSLKKKWILFIIFLALVIHYSLFVWLIVHYSL